MRNLMRSDMYNENNLKEKIMYWIFVPIIVVLLVGVWAFFVLMEKKDEHGPDFDQWTA